MSVAWRQALGDHMTLEALAYLRNSRRDTINGDQGDGGEGDPLASFNRTATRQTGGGLLAALSGQHGPHQWQAGASLDQASVRYQQTEQAATFDDSRGVVPLDEPTELSAQVRGSTRSLGLYATDTWKLAAGTHLTGTLRFNQARVGNQLDTVDDLTGDLESQAHETFTYRSWNPALGLSQRLDAGLTLFANIARNNRVPTVIELGCADPDQPCRLPAGLQSDPYLKQVVATTLEGGLRFGRGSGPRGSLTLFRTDNRNDILFRSVSVAGQLGYFQNFSRTRHQGLDAEFQMRVGTVDLSAGYSHLDATYQANGVLRQGERNVVIRPGTRIAGLPRQMLKLAADWSTAPGLTLGSDLQVLSSRGVSGNEDGLLEDGADSAYRQDLPGYAVLNLRASWKPTMWKGVELFARVNNAFDRRYASFGALAATGFDAQGAYTGGETSAVFVAPGAPRSLSAGVRASF